MTTYNDYKLQKQAQWGPGMRPPFPPGPQWHPGSFGFGPPQLPKPDPFKMDMDRIFSDPKLGGFDLSDADMMRYDQTGYNAYKNWPDLRQQFYDRNNQLRTQHETNLTNWHQLIRSFETQKGRAPNDMELQQLAAGFDKKFGPNSAKNAQNYAQVRVQRNSQRGAVSAGDTFKNKYPVTGGQNNPYPEPKTTEPEKTETTETPQAEDTPWYSTMYQLMQEHPGMSAGVAALLASSLIYGAGSGKKRDPLDVILALLGGGAAAWATHSWLSPSQQTAAAETPAPQAETAATANATT